MYLKITPVKAVEEPAAAAEVCCYNETNKTSLNRVSRHVEHCCYNKTSKTGLKPVEQVQYFEGWEVGGPLVPRAVQTDRTGNASCATRNPFSDIFGI